MKNYAETLARNSRVKEFLYEKKKNPKGFVPEVVFEQDSFFGILMNIFRRYDHTAKGYIIVDGKRVVWTMFSWNSDILKFHKIRMPENESLRGYGYPTFLFLASYLYLKDNMKNTENVEVIANLTGKGRNIAAKILGVSEGKIKSYRIEKQKKQYAINFESYEKKIKKTWGFR